MAYGASPTLQVSYHPPMSFARDWERYFWLGLLGPVLWLQGRHVRRVTPRLPEPPGVRAGRAGSGPLLRILIAGDSAAAGVGAPTQTEALSGQLLHCLQDHFCVDWQLLATTGLDTPGLLALLDATPPKAVDVVIVSIGVNDVTALTPPARWLGWQAQLAQCVEARFSPALLVHTAVPPMHVFCALPQPLRWFFGRWADAFNRQLAQALAGHPRRVLHTPFLSPVSAGLATDGFHPGPVAYAAWAQSLSQHILAARYDPGQSGVDPNRKV